jgi:DNA-binding NarL/FixJ family response regulator
VLIVDPLPLRNLGLVTVLKRLSEATKFRLASLTPDDAKRWIDTGAKCAMIIYNVGSASAADHRNLKQIKGLRARATEVPLVIVSDNDSREQIVSALGVGAQGFLPAGTNRQLALKALSFILKGGSYFPASVLPRRRNPAQLNGAMERGSLAATCKLGEGNGVVENALDAGSMNIHLTERQKSVLGRLGCGDSNKAIGRFLGIREGTVKVHVRRIMRKLGVVNRTQVAIACANSAEIRADDRIVNGKIDQASGQKRFRVSLADRNVPARRSRALPGSKLPATS